MQRGIPSVTAAAVSLARGMASLPGAPGDQVGDTRMRALFSAPVARALDALGTITARVPGAHAALRMASLGLVDHLALRTAALDAELARELASEVTQLVILGAGLDARAWRMPELAACTVWEVDHPSTQPLKQARARGRSPLAREVRFVRVDFATERIDEALAAHGHDASARTLWLWEGVVPYLPHAAIESTLAAIASRSAPGSVLCCTYGTPELTSVPFVPDRLVHASFRMLGEPLLGLMTPDEVRVRLESVGMRVERDTGPADWARAHYRARASRIVVAERLVVARAR